MVNIVGAGSGAVDLITIRGKKLIEEADVIIYAGSLINKDLLNFAKKDCLLFDSAHMHLEQVLERIKKAESENKMTVRLHTGDPCVYGAIKEQMVELDKCGIEYKYTPGVSSFCGAASALNVEYTLPGITQTVIITRIEGRTPVPEKESIKLLASHQATMVIFLSTGHLKRLSNELVEGGYCKSTAAAIVYKATWNDEKVVRTTIENLYPSAKENKITKTALIVVGNCLGDDYELSKLYDKHFSTEFRKGL